MIDKPSRGFARLSPEQRKEISSRGGRAAREKGGYVLTDQDRAKAREARSQEEFRKMCRAGGLKVSENREHMREIGKKGAMVKNTKTQFLGHNALECPTLALSNRTDPWPCSGCDPNTVPVSEDVRPDFATFAQALEAEADWVVQLHPAGDTFAQTDRETLLRLHEHVLLVGKKLGFL